MCWPQECTRIGDGLLRWPSGDVIEGQEIPSEAETLRDATRRAIESAEGESVDRYRGTDEPREFVRILREAIGEPGK